MPEQARKRLRAYAFSQLSSHPKLPHHLFEQLPSSSREFHERFLRCAHTDMREVLFQGIEYDLSHLR